MTNPILPKASRVQSEQSESTTHRAKSRKRRIRRSNKNSDVLVSAVVSAYLLTHLHHVLQRAEYGANREGKLSQAANYAQLRKVLCMDARSMEDASALGLKASDVEKFQDASNLEQKVA